MKNTCIAVLTALLLASCSPNVASTSPKEAAALFAERKAVIVDVREDDEWKAQHIEGAIHIPLGQLQSRLHELDAYKNSMIITQCRSGKRSAAAASALKDAGFNQVLNLAGGITAWSGNGLKTSKPN